MVLAEWTHHAGSGSMSQSTRSPLQITSLSWFPLSHTSEKFPWEDFASLLPVQQDSTRSIAAPEAETPEVWGSSLM